MANPRFNTQTTNRRGAMGGGMMKRGMYKKGTPEKKMGGKKKIDTKKIYNAQMINLIGDDITIYRNKTFKENEFFYDYLKKQVKAKRKMGHLTIIEK